MSDSHQSQFSIITQNIKNRHTVTSLCYFLLLISPLQNKLYTLILQKSSHRKRFTPDIRDRREGTDFVLSVQSRQLVFSQRSASDWIYLIFMLVNIHRDLCHFSAKLKDVLDSFLLVFASNGSEASSFHRVAVGHFQHSSRSNLFIIIIIHLMSM